MPTKSRMARFRVVNVRPSIKLCNILVTGFVLAVLSLAQTSRAAILDLTVTGVVTELTPSVSAVFSLNDSMSVVYTFDSNAIAQPSLILTQAVYPGAISGAGFSIGGYNGSAAGGNVNIENDDPTFHDGVSFLAAGLSSASIGTHDPVSFTVAFDDATDAALNSLALPTATSDLSGFSDRTWGLLFSPVPLLGVDPTAFVGGRITSATISTHPETVAEPPTLAMFGLGLAGLGFARRKRKAVENSYNALLSEYLLR